MKRFNFGLGIVIAALTLAAGPAFAQKPESGSSGGPQAGGGAVDRSTGGGAPSSGGAVDRGSGGAGGSSAGSSGSVVSSSSSGGSDFGSSSANAMSSPSLGVSSRSVRESAPEHRPGFGSRMSYAEDGQRATPRSSGGGSGGGTAVTRGGGSSGGGSSSSGSSPTSGGARSGSGDSSPSRTTGRMRTAPAPEHNAENSNNTTGAREVPTWSRPRGDRPATGTAVDRTVPVYSNGSHNGYGYYGYYSPYYGYYSPYYGYGYPGYGYNSYYYPYGFGLGYGLYSGFGWAPYYGDPFGDPYGYGGGSYSSSYGRGEQGNLKLKVKPRSAKVYVDGYFVGYVDQFDGAFQKLALNTGRHKVEVKADGFETAEFDVLINPEQTVTFQGELKRIQ
jgi:hypothetical protein